MTEPKVADDTGLDSFIEYVSSQAAVAPSGWAGAAWFILRVGEDCANIRLQDLSRPLRFLRQMAGVPPLRFSATRFRPDIVDDTLPARHYTAFLFVGFWLPKLAAVLVLYLWELAGFVRYGGYWSRRDIASGLLGIRHGALVGRYGPVVLPALIAADLVEIGARSGADFSSPASSS